MPEVRLIDANALKKAIADAFYNLREIAYISDIIERQPVIEAEPVLHGRWISEIVPYTDWKGQKRKRFQPISCSVCHTPVADATNFCPNCGADMREGGADNG